MLCVAEAVKDFDCVRGSSEMLDAFRYHLFLRRQCVLLPTDLVQQDTCGDGCVQRCDMTLHGNAQALIAFVKQFLRDASRFTAN